MTDRELMQQALEALERYSGVDQRACDVEEALRERLAQPEQEPVDNAEKAGAYLDARLWEFIDMAAAWPEAKPDPRTWEHLLVYAPKQPQMQPCAGRNCGSTNPNLHSAECFEDYEKATGMNQWQGLTDEELNEVMPYCHNEFDLAEFREFARNVEAKLRSKNQCK